MSDTRFQLLFGDHRDVILAIDRETGVVRDANATALSRLGRSRTRLLGMHHRDVCPLPDLTPAGLSAHAGHDPAGSGAVVVASVLPEDGSPIPGVISASCDLEVSGRPCIVVIFQPTGGRTPRGEGLAGVHPDLLAIFEMLPAAVYLSSRDHTAVEYLNAHFTHLFGYTIDDVRTTADWYRLAFPDEAQRQRIIAENIERLAAMSSASSGQSATRSHITTKNGEQRHVVWKMQRFGEHLLGCGIDITDATEARRAQRETEAYLRATIDGLSAHICVIDEAGTIVLTNAAYRAFAAANGGDIARCIEGANYLDVCETATESEPDEAGRFAQGIRDVLSGARDFYEMEYPCHSPAAHRWFIGRVTPLERAGRRHAIIAHEDITGRKQAEYERSVLVGRFDALAEHVPGVLFQFCQHPDGRTEFPFVTAGVRALHGLLPDALGRDPSSLFSRMHPDDIGQVSAALAEASASLGVLRLRYRFRHDDGRLIWIESEASPERLPDGGTLWHGYSHDITEQMEAEQALRTARDELRRSERLLRDIERVSQSGGWEYRVETGEMYWTPELYRIHDFPESMADHIQESLQCYLPEDRERIRLAFERCIAEGVGYDIEVPFMTFTKRARWIRTRTTAIRDGDRVVRIVGSVTDITARKEAEAQLLLVSKAVEHATEAIMICDPNHRIQYVNPAFTRLSGYTSEEAIGQTPRILRSGEHSADFYATLKATISGGGEWNGRTVNRAKDGRLYTEETSIVPVRDGDGQIVNYISTKRNITAVLQAEEARAAILEQFHQSQKMESIGRLAGGVAHDFNNLLMVIMGCGEMALDSLRPDDPLRIELQEMLDAGKRAANLTRQLLAFSRKQALAPERFDLNQLLVNLEKMLGRLIGEHIRLDLQLGQDIGPMLADPGQLEQVVMNLVVNARDAMPGGGSIRLETRRVPGDPARVQLVVKDTGTGMAQEVMERAFEPFFTTKAKGQGTGLGLSTVLGIVKQSGGDIHVTSVLGEGTTFQLDFPLCSLAPEAEVPRKALAAANGEREHILLVEDEESLRRMMERRLTSLGYVVTVAANGGEALLLVEEQGVMPDLVISDLVMPYMSGGQLSERLLRQRPSLRFLFMTGYADDVAVPDVAASPGRLVLQKPFTTEELSKALRRALATSGPVLSAGG